MRSEENYSRQANCEEVCLNSMIIEVFPKGNDHLTSKAVQM